MTAYGPPAVPRPAASPVQRAAMMFYIAGGLGVLSFVWGFLKWITEGDGSSAIKYGGYSLGSPGVAVVGFSLAAGLLAAAAAWEKSTASLLPVVLAATSLLLAIGILIGKGSISAGGGGGGPKTGIGIGLILELITVVVQIGVLVFGWMTANGKIQAKPAAPAWPAQPQQPYPGQPGAPAQPGQYGPPQTYGPGPAQQQPPAGPPQGYGPPPAGPPQGYGPPRTAVSKPPAPTPGLDLRARRRRVWTDSWHRFVSLGGMPVDHEDDAARRSVVPEAAGRSLWLAAVWTGVGAAVVCATLAIVAVAVCWLPVSGTSGHSRSAIHAGLLTFLAALHGGITVDGTRAAFLPLGMMIIVGLTAWRAGSGLADAANSLDEADPTRLGLAGAAQALSFMIVCLVAVPFAALGTSGAPFVGVGLASLVLFTITGGVAFVRSSALADVVAERVPTGAGPVLRSAAAGVTWYLGIGALLVAGSLVVHSGRVAALSQQVGGGWGSVPILLLSVLAAPNAIIAGAAYLAGPGFAVGAGGTASAVSTAHGVLPAFPLLGAMPEGHGAIGPVWWLIALTPLAAGLALARLAGRAEGWVARLGVAAAAAGTAGVVMFLLAWQGGGGIGGGRLHTVGASPWRLGLFVAVELSVVSCTALGLAFVAQRLRGASGDVEWGSETRHLVVMDGADEDAAAANAAKPNRAGKLAG